mmetsp:Transcript_100801/g.289139  ORF Transcript_100801/g.289139 Transcript_100801/m.289139 type:complete len:583 (-) Transcript_100801:236-1984(-)
MRWQTRYFILDGCKLRYYKDGADLSHVRGELSLDSKSTVMGLTSKTNGFQVVLAGGGQALKLAAESPEVAAEWKLALTTSIENASAMHTVNMQGEDFVVDEHYHLVKKVGAGAYGMVVAGTDTKNEKHNADIFVKHPGVQAEIDALADDATAVARLKENYGFKTTKVAIKKVKGAFDDMIDAKRILREVRLMRQFSHPNVIALHDMITPSSVEGFNDVYIITELMSRDLQEIIFSRTPLSEDQQQWIMYQCLAGLNYMHMAGVVHRDLKPSNILIDTDTCDVRLCDFGLSRGVLHEDVHDHDGEDGHEPLPKGEDHVDVDPTHAEADPDHMEEAPQEEMTVYVVTRWYRAPEVMLEYHKYGTEIDMWSMGCILGELLGRKPLLQGRNTMDQLKLIVKLLGSCEEDDLWYVTNRNARSFMLNMPNQSGVDLNTKFASFLNDGGRPEAIDLVSQVRITKSHCYRRRTQTSPQKCNHQKHHTNQHQHRQQLLAMDPNKRMKCGTALEHTWLTDVREASKHEVPPGFTVVCDDIESMPLTKPNLQAKIYEEIHQFHENASGKSDVITGQKPSALSPASSTGAAEQS